MSNKLFYSLHWQRNMKTLHITRHQYCFPRKYLLNAYWIKRQRLSWSLHICLLPQWVICSYRVYAVLTLNASLTHAAATPTVWPYVPSERGLQQQTLCDNQATEPRPQQTGSSPMHAPAAVAKAKAQAEAERICGFKLKEKRKRDKKRMRVKNKVEHGCRCTV